MSGLMDRTAHSFTVKTKLALVAVFLKSALIELLVSELGMSVRGNTGGASLCSVAAMLAPPSLNVK